jgi:peptidoglycan LD-endopeptidase LytH
MKSRLENTLENYRNNFRCVVDYKPATDKLFRFNFTSANKELSDEVIADTKKFSEYINSKLENSHSKYGVGGYNEDRILYKKSSHFKISGTKVSPLWGDVEETRSIHLGIDIWANAGTKVYVPIGGTVHSFAYNDQMGDYGATIILQHQLDSITFHTLYGHLSLKDLVPLQQGKYISRGELLGHFGTPIENGDWPPHLHFQIIEDMRVEVGDYPGVCSIAEREKYLRNCPDADLILNIMGTV